MRHRRRRKEVLTQIETLVLRCQLNVQVASQADRYTGVAIRGQTGLYCRYDLGLSSLKMILKLGLVEVIKGKAFTEKRKAIQIEVNS